MGKRIDDLDPYGSYDIDKMKGDIYEVSKNTGTSGSPIYPIDGSKRIRLDNIADLVALLLELSKYVRKDGPNTVADVFSIIANDLAGYNSVGSYVPKGISEYFHGNANNILKSESADFGRFTEQSQNSFFFYQVAKNGSDVAYVTLDAGKWQINVGTYKDINFGDSGLAVNTNGAGLYANIKTDYISEEYTVQFPDKPSGTYFFAMLSDLLGYLPLTGGVMSGDIDFNTLNVGLTFMGESSINNDGTGLVIQDNTNRIILNAPAIVFVSASDFLFFSPHVTASTVPYFNSTRGLVSSSVTPTELGYLSGVTSAIQAQINALVGAGTGYLKLDASNGPMTGYLILNADPTTALGAATKAYVDNLITGISWKPAVVAATTSNITLSGTQTIDGIAVIAGDRVLVKNQTTQTNNGVYVVSAGSWTRALDGDTASEILGSTVYVESGTVNGGTQWSNSNTSITLGSTNIAFVKIAGAGVYTNGSGLSLTGNVFAIAAGGVTNSMLAGGINLASKVTGLLPDANISSASAWNAKANQIIPTSVKTTNYTASANELVPVDTTIGNVTITLPATPADKTIVVVKQVTRGGTNNVTVNCAGSAVFNKSGGATSATLTLLGQGNYMQYQSSTDIWFIIADDLPLSQLDLRFESLANKGTGTGALSTSDTTYPTENKVKANIGRPVMTTFTGNISGAVSIDLSVASMFILTLTGNVTSFTFTNETVGASYMFVFKKGTTQYSFAYTAAKFEFPFGNAPTLTDPTTNGTSPAYSKDIVSFLCTETGYLSNVITPDLQKN